MAEKDYGKFRVVEFLDFRDERYQKYRDRIKAARKARRLRLKLDRKEFSNVIKKVS